MKILYFTYGVVCYLIFFVTLLYTIGFVGNYGVPKSMDSGADGTSLQSIIINSALIALFAIQHSLMARQSFKEKWRKIIPDALERNTYVLFSSLALLLVFYYWQPMGTIIWDVSGSTLGTVLTGLSLAGWAFVLISTFLLDHFELLGLKQAYYNLTNRQIPSGQFKTPGFYKVVRHPIYFGFTLAFWATPLMTSAHLVFALGMLVYTVIGIHLEEKDLITAFGNEYKAYKAKVSMLFPLPPKK